MNNKVNRILKVLMSLGMVGVVTYFIHTILGNILWESYNPITTDISSLTAVGAPNRQLLRVFTSIYGICMLLFTIGMIIYAFKFHHILIRIGYSILFFMQMTSAFGYALFPLEGNKTVMTFQNTMHIVVTVIVVFTTIVGVFFLAIGYMKEEKTKKLGKIILVFACLITGFGLLNPINMAMEWGILGLTERLVIYTLQVLMFMLSYIYTFKVDMKY